VPKNLTVAFQIDSLRETFLAPFFNSVYRFEGKTEADPGS